MSESRYPNTRAVRTLLCSLPCEDLYHIPANEFNALFQAFIHGQPMSGRRQRRLLQEGLERLHRIVESKRTPEPVLTGLPQNVTFVPPIVDVKRRRGGVGLSEYEPAMPLEQPKHVESPRELCRDIPAALQPNNNGTYGRNRSTY